jgi:hypothetical protein
VNETPETSETAPAAAPESQNPTPPEQSAASVTRAVLAIPVRSNTYDGWAGRILNHAPGPAETVRVLREILGKRHTGRHRVAEAVSELIYDHPAGWEHLGAAPAADGAARRRGQMPLGTCRCHLPDGAARPGLARAERRALISAEWGRPVRGEAPEGLEADPDGTPWRITANSTLPAHVEHVFLLDDDMIEIFARDNSADRKASRDQFVHGYSPLARVRATRPLDWEEFAPHLDAASAKVRARLRTDWNRVHAAAALTRAAKELEQIPAHADLLLYLLGKHSGQDSTEQTAEAALAEAARVHSADLPALLLRAPRVEQLRLLRDAAHLTDPAEHPAL